MTEQRIDGLELVALDEPGSDSRLSTRVRERIAEQRRQDGVQSEEEE
jgi:hypothetical protein